jgi:alkylated DNA repair dioxygenase AlkB
VLADAREASLIASVLHDLDVHAAHVEHDAVERGRSRLLRTGFDQRGRPSPVPMPDWCASLGSWAMGLVGLTAHRSIGPFDSALLCEYPPGCSLGPHRDSQAYVGGVVVACLGADAEVAFRPLAAVPGRRVGDAPAPPGAVEALPRRSVYMLAGDALEGWTHEVLPTCPDGGTRYSVVLRRAWQVT